MVAWLDSGTDSYIVRYSFITKSRPWSVLNTTRHSLVLAYTNAKGYIDGLEDTVYISLCLLAATVYSQSAAPENLLQKDMHACSSNREY